MRLTSYNNLAFVPLLESILKEYWNFDVSSDLLNYYSDKFYNASASNRSRDNSLVTIGLDNVTGNEDYLFIWTVKDVINIIKTNTKLKDGCQVITTLQTHVKELSKAGFNCILVSDNVSDSVPFLVDSNQLNEKYFPKKTEILMNPTSETPINDLLSAKAFIKYNPDAFTPGPDCYANEYCEVYQLANIFKVPVYSAVTSGELTTLNIMLSDENL